MNHDSTASYDSPVGYSENVTKKSVKLDSRQSNIEKIRVRKAKVIFCL